MDSSIIDPPHIHPSLKGILKPAAGEFGSGVEIVHGINDVERITGEEVEVREQKNNCPWSMVVNLTGTTWEDWCFFLNIHLCMIFRQYFMYYVYVTLHVFGVTISGGGGFFSVKSRNTRILQNMFFC